MPGRARTLLREVLGNVDIDSGALLGPAMVAHCESCGLDAKAELERRATAGVAAGAVAEMVEVVAAGGRPGAVQLAAGLGQPLGQHPPRLSVPGNEMGVCVSGGGGLAAVLPMAGAGLLAGRLAGAAGAVGGEARLLELLELLGAPGGAGESLVGGLAGSDSGTAAGGGLAAPVGGSVQPGTRDVLLVLVAALIQRMAPSMGQPAAPGSSLAASGSSFAEHGRGASDQDRPSHSVSKLVAGLQTLLAMPATAAAAADSVAAAPALPDWAGLDGAAVAALCNRHLPLGLGQLRALTAALTADEAVGRQGEEEEAAQRRAGGKEQRRGGAFGARPAKRSKLSHHRGGGGDGPPPSSSSAVLTQPLAVSPPDWVPAEPAIRTAPAAGAAARRLEALFGPACPQLASMAATLALSRC